MPYEPQKRSEVHIYMDQKLRDRLEALAKENGLSLTAQARMLLTEALRKAERKAA